MPRSELQDRQTPICPGDTEGQHCACIDSEDSCCDCPAHVTVDGEGLCFEAHSLEECSTCAHDWVFYPDGKASYGFCRKCGIGMRDAIAKAKGEVPK